MKYNKLGNSELAVSECCLGTMTFGEQNTEAQAHEQLDYALAQGVNFFDMAELYPVPAKAETQGRTEQYFGTWLAKQDRSKIVIATKVIGCGGPGPSHITAGRTDPKQEPYPARLNRKQIREAVKGSLRRLGTDYVDVYQTHWPDRYVPGFGGASYDRSKERDYVPFEETIGAIGELIKEGTIRHWGLSNETTFGVCEIMRVCKELSVPAPVTIQNSYSLLHRSFEQELAEACSPLHHNIGLLPWSVLAGGSLSGKYTDGSNTDQARLTKFKKFMSRFGTEQSLKASAKYAEIAREAGITPSQLAIAWCRGRDFIPSTIIGATTMKQLEENIKAFDIVLDQATIEKINKVHLEIRNPSLQD